jgi:hypothetical protein
MRRCQHTADMFQEHFPHEEPLVIRPYNDSYLVFEGRHYVESFQTFKAATDFVKAQTADV